MKIFIVIDAQNDFITGPLSTPDSKAAADKILDFLQNNNSSNNLVLFTKDTHTINYLNTREGSMLPVPHCIFETPGWSIYKPISEFVDKHSVLCTFSNNNIIKSRITKTTFGSFTLPNVLMDIEAELAKNNQTIEEIVFMGFCTDVCVVSNVLITKAAFPEVPIVVIEDACAGTSYAKHLIALSVMQSCQIDFRFADEE